MTEMSDLHTTRRAGAARFLTRGLTAAATSVAPFRFVSASSRPMSPSLALLRGIRPAT
ncbi:hypothetical protein ACFXQA_14615 [Microbacterium sp. P07]|uniref:hypothetical protein n=1 Tax=Microbacterium sp. P07 TaxID=3366952 RepID=UPI0037463808